MVSLFSLTSALLAGLASAELFKLDFTRTSIGSVPLSRRSLELPMRNDLFHQRYTVNLTIGTPPQPFSLTLDTGSSDVWVPAPNSSGCLPEVCPPGTFDAAKSSTFKEIGVPYHAYFGLTPDLQVVGQYFNDTLRIGNAMAIVDVPKTLFEDGIFGLLGLGTRIGEASFNDPKSPLFQNVSATFPTLYDQLQLHGYTRRRAFSMWLNDISAATGRIIFGGIDTTKYYGPLVSLPVPLIRGTFSAWAVVLTSVARSNSHGTELLTAKNFSISTILDSGSPNMYLPSALVQSISSTMNATMHSGFQYVPCATRKSPESLIFGFGPNAGGPRIKIRVPYAELIYTYGAPANIGPVNAEDGTRLCYLGVIGTEGTILLLGDTFIRSAYLVYDVDYQRVGMAPVRYDEGRENVVEIPAGMGFPGQFSLAG